ncbi:type III polyketide synthase [Deinococcus maricopensis]|uniref:Naringenin-chalcone synthase n=1 Tax=Deinococcus maricopensis (strain DSM 21211 / LMG 22137 / NRRL B-23946 / LB-34) TaxID=709986 RepID=E8UBT2_DEIML|nr:3-oxoacyl-[acyl-carrier-protein] synthase III C-terminal domain-containing protein [Deinococcus maricopensis]ADV68521.1 Naringenin-chalcone synthase [Deinococcus maricopensis DSM 21211]
MPVMTTPAGRTPIVRALVTGTPPHRTPQTAIREAARTLFPRMSQRQQMLDVFTNANIDTRFLARPLDWYLEPHDFADKNAVYVQETLALSERLTLGALQQANVAPADVDAVVFVSSTGISTPSLDATLMNRLGLNPHAVRLPLWGLGCAGGAAGLARAADLVRAGFQRVLLLAVELCSLTLVRNDESKSNFVGTGLFADGGAALLLTPDDGAGGLARLHGARSTLIPDSEDIMGWDVVGDGLKVRFSRDIPTLVRRMMRDNADEALRAAGWTRDDAAVFVVHPGGTKVIAAYEDALSLPPGALDASRETLRGYGNMSSATVLFVLQETLRRGAHGRGLLSAMGPGFSAEHVLIELP